MLILGLKLCKKVANFLTKKQFLKKNKKIEKKRKNA